MDRIIMHIDVNNAFLSWTAIDLLNKGSKYDIRNSYAVIGGDEDKRHGIVLAKSMLAKKLGIKTADTLYSARQKCPNLRVYPANFKFYQEMSNKLFKIISNYSPDIEVASVDECYLDYTSVRNLYGDPIEFAYKLKKEIYDKLGFTVNIGVANNKLCAKMASDFEKPYKVHTLFMNEVKNKMWPLPVGDLYGVGKMSVPKLIGIGINTIGDLAHADSNKLYIYFKNQTTHLINKANGIDDSIVDSSTWIPKGIGNEITLDKDLRNKDLAYNYLMQLSDKVARRLREQEKYASVVIVVLKDNKFRRRSHQIKINNATNITSGIYETSKKVLDEMWNDEPIRLIGVRLDNLSEEKKYQVSLFENVKQNESDETLERLIDSLKNKFGNNIINKASLTNNNKITNDDI